MKHLTQLKATLNASGWSQEQLANKLGVSFVTLNSWVNERSRPRRKALVNIEKLYLDIVGVEEVDIDNLRQVKLDVQKLHSSARAIVGNKKILDKLTLYITYHSNTIEGSTMTLSDVEDVIFEHKVLSNRSAIEQAEARNHQATLHWLLDKLVSSGKSFIIDEALILGIHLRLMNGIISDAGEYRKHAVRIMGSHVVLADWTRVPELITGLAAEIKKPQQDIIEVLATTHARFEQIHPFSDGNGRVGRLILLAQALQAGLVPPLVVKERKYAYYKYLELAQSRDNHMPLELFVSESIQFTNTLLKNRQP